MRVEGVQGVLTLFCGGGAQTCHDDLVVELKEQLVVEEVDGEGQEGKVKEEGRSRIKENAPWWCEDDNVIAQNLSHEVCGVIMSVEQCALCASSMHDVHHAIVEVNVVIGVLVVHCELLLVRVVPDVICDDAVVRRTLGLIAFIVAFIFVVAIFQRILLYWRYSAYRSCCACPPITTWHQIALLQGQEHLDVRSLRLQTYTRWFSSTTHGNASC